MKPPQKTVTDDDTFTGIVGTIVKKIPKHTRRIIIIKKQIVFPIKIAFGINGLATEQLLNLTVFMRVEHSFCRRTNVFGTAL